MPPSAQDRLRDILEAISLIERATHGMDGERFANDAIARGATERFLSIACEASLRLPDGIKQQAAHIDWLKMNNFANLLRHAYHVTDVEYVWHIVQNHIPPLKAFVESRIRE